VSPRDDHLGDDSLTVSVTSTSVRPSTETMRIEVESEVAEPVMIATARASGDHEAALISQV
jgi:hypothetical protein